MYENPLYEQRRNLDRQAGMESERKIAEHKRKHDDDDDGDIRDDQKKSKLGKDEGKRSKYKDGEEDKTKVIKEDEQKAKYIKEEENKPKYKKEEEELVKFKKEEEKQKIKKEEDERIKYKKEEEKARRVREGEERNKYKREEEDRYRQWKEEEERNRSEEERTRYREENRYRYREDDAMYRYKKEDERSRYGREDTRHGGESEEDKRPKHRGNEGGRWPKSKWEGDNEERTKYEKREDKSQRQKDKTGRSKDGSAKTTAKDAKTEPEKTSEPPKVMCGPSPAMLAKLRKKNEETTGRPAFGKFSWKKPEKTALEKEAERIAAQFIKEDEESIADTAPQETQKESEDHDAFAKSMAAAKSIAIKLSGKTVLPPSQEWEAYNQNKKNLPSTSTSNILRKSSVGLQNKQAPLNASPSTAPTADPISKSLGSGLKNQAQKEAVLSADLISKAFEGQEVQLKIPRDNISHPPPTSGSLTATTVPPLTTPPMPPPTPPVPPPTTPFMSPPTANFMPPPPTAPFMPPPPTTSFMPPPPATSFMTPPPATSFMTPPPTSTFMPPPTSTVNESEAVQLKSPGECIVSLESDVAVPGVPEDEQNLTVVVRPPPQLLTHRDFSSKSDKRKTSLAAAKAKDLFDIFYSGSSTMASSNVGSKHGPKSSPKADSECQMTTQGKEDKGSTKDEGPKTGDSAEVTESNCEEPSAARETKVTPPTVDKGSLIKETQVDKASPGKETQVEGSLDKEPQVDKSSLSEDTGPQVYKDSKTLGVSENVENDERMETGDKKNEASTLDCEASSAILANMEIMETNDNHNEENTLDSEDAITVSFSPPPGSFTEQLNLDTFEFNFDSL